MKIKNILVGLLLLSSIVHASSRGLPDAGKSSSPKSRAAAAATTQAITADDLIVMYRYFDRGYYKLIGSLRKNERVSREEIFDALRGDPFLEKMNDGGHGTFKHKILPLTFGVSAHNNGLVNVNERQGQHKALQVYVNVINLFLQPLLDMHGAMKDLETMSPQEWQQAHGAKFNEATNAFNAMASADWNNLSAAQEAVFEEYSRD